MHFFSLDWAKFVFAIEYCISSFPRHTDTNAKVKPPLKAYWFSPFRQQNRPFLPFNRTLLSCEKSMTCDFGKGQPCSSAINEGSNDIRLAWRVIYPSCGLVGWLKDQNVIDQGWKMIQAWNIQLLQNFCWSFLESLFTWVSKLVGHETDTTDWPSYWLYIDILSKRWRDSFNSITVFLILAMLDSPTYTNKHI